MTALRPDQIEKQFDQAAEKIKKSILEYQREGSGWRFDHVLNLNLNVASYKPLRGSSYLELPKKLRDKKAVVNIKNDDRKCFLWSVLAAKHSVHRRNQPHRLSHYQEYEEEFNMSGIEYPVKVSQVAKFEKQNPTTSINVNDGELFPLYVTEDKKVNCRNADILATAVLTRVFTGLSHLVDRVHLDMAIMEVAGKISGSVVIRLNQVQQIIG